MKYHSFVLTPADHPSPPVLPCHHGKEPLGKVSYHSLVAKIIFTNATPKSRHPCTASFARCCKNTFMDISSVKMISGPPAPTTPPIALS